MQKKLQNCKVKCVHNKAKKLNDSSHEREILQMG